MKITTSSTNEAVDHELRNLVAQRSRNAGKVEREQVRSFFCGLRKQQIEERERHRAQVRSNPAYRDLLADPEFQQLDAALEALRLRAHMATARWEGKLWDELSRSERADARRIREQFEGDQDCLLWAIANIMRQYGFGERSASQSRSVMGDLPLTVRKRIRAKIMPRRAPGGTRTRAVSLRTAWGWWLRTRRELIHEIETGVIAAEQIGSNRWVFELDDLHERNPSVLRDADPMERFAPPSGNSAR